MAVCNKCKGIKTILGMGNIKEKCPVCKGIGVILDDIKKPKYKKIEKSKNKE